MSFFFPRPGERSERSKHNKRHLLETRRENTTPAGDRRRRGERTVHVPLGLPPQLGAASDVLPQFVSGADVSELRKVGQYHTGNRALPPAGFAEDEEGVRRRRTTIIPAATTVAGEGCERSIIARSAFIIIIFIILVVGRQ
jgi:hypothetical protein